jgi:hypothetical protein
MYTHTPNNVLVSILLPVMGWSLVQRGLTVCGMSSECNYEVPSREAATRKLVELPHIKTYLAWINCLIYQILYPMYLLHRPVTLYSDKAAVVDLFNSCYCLTSLTLDFVEAGRLWGLNIGVTNERYFITCASGSPSLCEQVLRIRSLLLPVGMALKLRSQDGETERLYKRTAKYFFPVNE